VSRLPLVNFSWSLDGTFDGAARSAVETEGESADAKKKKRHISR